MNPDGIVFDFNGNIYWLWKDSTGHILVKTIWDSVIDIDYQDTTKYIVVIFKWDTY